MLVLITYFSGRILLKAKEKKDGCEKLVEEKSLPVRNDFCSLVIPYKQKCSVWHVTCVTLCEGKKLTNKILSLFFSLNWYILFVSGDLTPMLSAQNHSVHSHWLTRGPSEDTMTTPECQKRKCGQHMQTCAFFPFPEKNLIGVETLACRMAIYKPVHFRVINHI